MKKIILIFILNFINTNHAASCLHRGDRTENRGDGTEKQGELKYVLRDGTLVTQDPMKVLSKLQKILTHYGNSFGNGILFELYYFCKIYKDRNCIEPIFITPNNVGNSTYCAVRDYQLFLIDSEHKFLIGPQLGRIIFNCIHAQKKCCGLCYSMYLKDPQTGQIYNDEDNSEFH